MIESIFDFITKSLSIFQVLRIAVALCVVFSIVSLIYSLFYHLGRNLKKRKIAIFSSRETFESLSGYLMDSNIFKQKNIVHIEKNNIEKAKHETMYIVEWKTLGEDIDKIFGMRPSLQTPVVIYAQPGEIPREKMGEISARANTVVVNARGRLLNDVFVSMMTSGYKKNTIASLFKKK